MPSKSRAIIQGGIRVDERDGPKLKPLKTSDVHNKKLRGEFERLFLEGLNKHIEGLEKKPPKKEA